MRTITDAKMEQICNNIINGNLKDARVQIKKLNKLQLANFMSRSNEYGVPRHNAYTQVQFALEGSN